MKKPILFSLVIAACLAMAVETRFVEAPLEYDGGYDPPPSIKERHEMYGDDEADVSLKQAHPELFEGN